MGEFESIRSLKRFGEIVRSVRKRKNLSQSELAEKLHEVAQGDISDIENGQRNVTLKTALNILNILGYEFEVTRQNLNSEQSIDIGGRSLS